ncbi:hypothetical protein HWQ46_12305 [Shewanella sp. D64]|uniref:hypothetical protein n=1 Tax=unclassified Shewanella TaxID=196818 RepID=UPI0022BA56F8|nr:MULTISPECIES: hypothetical protein [unclassified Shewanella]MEC4726334.1 hypothetical protein [Shewanella sp. D64]MEC4738346.1 hypothetical protein [Shewanella sp. E94]WBJ95480.1 hypothetical protein HWQ47_27485 [Shewanella sp. MTB7]
MQSKNLTQLREEIEALVLTIPHVVGVAEGLDNQKNKVIQILINCPLNQFNPPASLINDKIIFKFVGDIQAR